MDDQRARPAVARVQHRELEQPAAEAAPAAAWQHRDAELGGVAGIGLARVRQMRHRHQPQPRIEDAKDLVALEVDLLHVAADLFVGGHLPEAAVPVQRLQRQ